MLEGSIKRVYFSESSVRDKLLKEYMSASGRYLANEKIGFEFEYIYSILETDGRGKATWQIEPK